MASESGPWSICTFAIQDGTDSFDYFTVKWGFDSKEEAKRSLSTVAKEAGVAEDDLVIVLAVWPQELDQ